MKHIVLLLFIMGFLGATIFGPIIFNNSMIHTNNTDCAASAIDGIACPVNTFASVIHHISVLQNFSRALVSSAGWFLLIWLALSSFAWVAIFYRERLCVNQEITSRCFNEFISHVFCGRRKIISWLSLFEQSPSF